MLPCFQLDYTASIFSRLYINLSQCTHIFLPRHRVVTMHPCIFSYYTALERTLFLDHISDEHLRLWKINCDVHRRGLELVKPGARCCDIATELNEIYKQHDLLQYRSFGYGHSFGILCHYYGREAGELGIWGCIMIIRWHLYRFMGTLCWYCMVLQIQLIKAKFKYLYNISTRLIQIENAIYYLIEKCRNPWSRVGL